MLGQQSLNDCPTVAQPLLLYRDHPAATTHPWMKSGPAYLLFRVRRMA
jgi:hypothetical protein